MPITLEVNASLSPLMFAVKFSIGTKPQAKGVEAEQPEAQPEAKRKRVGTPTCSDSSGPSNGTSESQSSGWTVCETPNYQWDVARVVGVQIDIWPDNRIYRSKEWETGLEQVVDPSCGTLGAMLLDAAKRNRRLRGILQTLLQEGELSTRSTYHEEIEVTDLHRFEDGVRFLYVGITKLEFGRFETHPMPGKDRYVKLSFQLKFTRKLAIYQYPLVLCFPKEVLRKTVL